MNWTIGRKIIGGFLVVALLTGIAGVVGIISIDTMGDSISQITGEEAPIVEAANEMKFNLSVARNTLEEYKGATSVIATDDQSALSGLESKYAESLNALILAFNLDGVDVGSV